MEFLKKVWPFSFETKDVTNLVVKAILYVLFLTVASVLMGVLSNVAVINVIFYVLGSLVDLYVLVGLVVLFLSYFKVLK